MKETLLRHSELLENPSLAERYFMSTANTEQRTPVMSYSTVSTHQLNDTVMLMMVDLVHIKTIKQKSLSHAKLQWTYNLHLE